MFEKTEGTAQKIAGKVQSAVGAITGDTSTEAEGKAREYAGRAQEGYGEVIDQFRESAVTSPIGTIAFVAGLGFLIGAWWAKRD